jgi:ATPase subunit of ABC transporter with duplicated ATPase domains
MPQNYEELLPLEQTPVEFLSDGSRQSISMMRTYLGSMKFTADEMTHPMRELSGGQKAKIMLLYLDTSGCDVLLLDEPSRNFSPLSNPVIRRMLAGYRGAIISVSHDRKYIAEVCDQIYELTADGLIRTDPAIPSLS